MADEAAEQAPPSSEPTTDGVNNWPLVRYNVSPYRTYNFFQQFRSNKSNPNNFLRVVKWSSDGSCFLTYNDDSTLRGFSLPYNDIGGSDAPTSLADSGLHGAREGVLELRGHGKWKISVEEFGFIYGSKVVVLTGAGISTESGIPDYRRQIHSQQLKGRVSCVKVRPVDITGAGDAFTGATLYCLASDVNILKDEKWLREALLFANACGGLAITKNSAIPTLPTKDEVQQIMEGFST